MKPHKIYPDGVLLENDAEAEAAERVVRQAPRRSSILEPTASADEVRKSICDEFWKTSGYDL